MGVVYQHSAGLLYDDPAEKVEYPGLKFQQVFSGKEDLTESQFKERCAMSRYLETAPDTQITLEEMKNLPLD